MAYIKLGPKGKFFASKKYNIYLVPGNAAIVNDTILYTDLAKFIVTGYFIEISLNEYQNLKLNQSNDPNTSYAPKGVNTISTIEPVNNISNLPPGGVSIGSRFIIDKGAINEWTGASNSLAEWNGISWTIIKPQDGWVVPLLELGIAATYRGTYPSGRWEIDYNLSTDYIDDIIGSTPTTPTIDTSTWERLKALVEEEALIREEADTELLSLINGLVNSNISTNAANVSLDNPGNIFGSDNVQVGMENLIYLINTQGNNLQNLVNQVQAIDVIVQSLQQGGGTGGSVGNVILQVVFIGVTSLSYNHNAGRLPQCKIYEAINPDVLIAQNPVVSGVVFREILAKPYNLNTISVAYEFTKPKNVVLTIIR